MASGSSSCRSYPGVHGDGSGMNQGQSSLQDASGLEASLARTLFDPDIFYFQNAHPDSRTGPPRLGNSRISGQDLQAVSNAGPSLKLEALACLSLRNWAFGSKSPAERALQQAASARMFGCTVPKSLCLSSSSKFAMVVCTRHIDAEDHGVRGPA